MNLSEPFQQRVVAEKAALDGNLERLQDFLAGRPFQALPEEDRQLLTLQHGVMQLYSRVLAQRIERFQCPTD